jgi:hypothetical protein
MSEAEQPKITADFLGFAWANLSPRDRARIMADSPRMLWLFGAGASCHYDLNTRSLPVPLANGFFLRRSITFLMFD